MEPLHGGKILHCSILEPLLIQYVGKENTPGYSSYALGCLLAGDGKAVITPFSIPFKICSSLHSVYMTNGSDKGHSK